MLLSSTAEAMYWTGRYFERAQALARAVGGYERLSLDSAEGEPLDLTPLLALASREPPPRALTRGEVLSALVFDAQNPSSVLGALEAARENLRSGRTVMPAAVWAPVNRLHARLGELDPNDTAAVLSTLDAVCAIGSQVEGETTASMTRDAAYSFWCIGSCLERADMSLRTLDVLLPRLAESGERRFHDVCVNGLLECVGAQSMFRRRHQTHRDLPTILDFLIGERTFPRSYAGLLTAIESELDALPRPAAAQSALAACRSTALATSESSSDVLPHLQRLLARLDQLGEVISDVYFPAGHRRASAEPAAEVASPSIAGDPFESLGREHETVEAVLRLLDELSASTSCGNLVDRGALRAIVDFFTDFGVLGHHEKEEVILMPALTRAGFDWQDGPLAAMRRDHRQEHYFLRVLAHLCAQHGEWSSEDRRRFVSVSTEFTRFLRAHMRHESIDVFQPAAAKLPEQAKATLMEDLARFDARSSSSVSAALARLHGLLDQCGVALRTLS